jgi:hypothetical protein
MGNASTNGFSGNLVFDNDVQFFNYRAPHGGTFSVNTFSFPQSGSTSTLALYNTAGARLFTDFGAAADHCGAGAAGSCFDSTLSQSSVATVTAADVSQTEDVQLIPITVELPPGLWKQIGTSTESRNPFLSDLSQFGSDCGQPGLCLNAGAHQGWESGTIFVASPGVGVSGAPPPAQNPEARTSFLMLAGLAVIAARVLRSRKRENPA